MSNRQLCIFILISYLCLLDTVVFTQKVLKYTSPTPHNLETRNTTTPKPPASSHRGGCNPGGSPPDIILGGGLVDFEEYNGKPPNTTKLKTTPHRVGNSSGGQPPSGIVGGGLVVHEEHDSKQPKTTKRPITPGREGNFSGGQPPSGIDEGGLVPHGESTSQAPKTTKRPKTQNPCGGNPEGQPPCKIVGQQPGNGSQTLDKDVGYSPKFVHSQQQTLYVNVSHMNVSSVCARVGFTRLYNTSYTIVNITIKLNQGKTDCTHVVFPSNFSVGAPLNTHFAITLNLTSANGSTVYNSTFGVPRGSIRETTTTIKPKQTLTTKSTKNTLDLASSKNQTGDQLSSASRKKRSKRESPQEQSAINVQEGDASIS